MERYRVHKLHFPTPAAPVAKPQQLGLATQTCIE